MFKLDDIKTYKFWQTNHLKSLILIKDTYIYLKISNSVLFTHS